MPKRYSVIEQKTTSWQKIKYNKIKNRTTVCKSILTWIWATRNLLTLGTKALRTLPKPSKPRNQEPALTQGLQAQLALPNPHTKQTVSSSHFQHRWPSHFRKTHRVTPCPGFSTPIQQDTNNALTKTSPRAQYTSQTLPLTFNPLSLCSPRV